MLNHGSRLRAMAAVGRSVWAYRATGERGAPSITVRQVAKSQKCSEATARRALREAVDMGFVESVEQYGSQRKFYIFGQSAIDAFDGGWLNAATVEVYGLGAFTHE